MANNTVLLGYLFCSLYFLQIDLAYQELDTFRSESVTLSTGTPQGCVLSPMLYSLFTHDCLSCHVGTKILKFADDTTVIGLITNSDESEYRDQVNKLISWCSDNNLELNVNKTKEMIVDFRRKKSSPPSPLVIDGRTVEIVNISNFSVQQSPVILNGN